MHKNYMKSSLLFLSSLFIGCGGGGGTSDPIPTPTPTAVHTPVPTTIPTAVPTAVSTPTPTAVPTAVPTSIPTIIPTVIMDSNLTMNENDTLSFEVTKKVTLLKVEGSTHGNATIKENNITYTPEKSFYGTDDFVYEYRDENGDVKKVKVSLEIKDFILFSSSYQDGERIPKIHVCSDYAGSDYSPQLSWENAPKTTTSFAIIMDDEVSPCGTRDNACKHWGLFNISSETLDLEENINTNVPTGVVLGENYMGSKKYAGPCPPDTHVYKTTLYALGNEMPNLQNVSMSRSKFESTYKKHILNSVTLSGVFP